MVLGFKTDISDDVLLFAYLEDQGWTWLAPGCQEQGLGFSAVLGLHQSEAWLALPLDNSQLNKHGGGLKHTQHCHDSLHEN